MKILLGPIQLFFTLVIALTSFKASANLRSEVLAQEVVKVMQKMRWSNRCESFVSSSQIGPYGEYILRSLNRSAFPELYRSTSDLAAICPNFDNLRDREKDYVWLLFLTSLAFYESTCNPKASAPGPNGTAQGLMQLHLNKEHFYSAGCVRGDSLQPNLTLSCSLSMLNDQIRREQLIFKQNSYWEVLQPTSTKAGEIAKALKLFSLCQSR